MERTKIDFEQLNVNAIAMWQGQGMLLTSGDFSTGEFNTMTVGWGSMGVMWNLPFIQVVVRPVRYTYKFMENFDTFTLTSFSKEFAPALKLLGNTSGRDGDKIKKSGLTPIPSTLVPSPGFEQAELIFECRKIYWDDMEKAQFLDPRLEKKYPAKDYHRIYYGEILAIYGDPKFL
ncbi:MAG: flavin reductase [Anaerolineales bacterium]